MAAVRHNRLAALTVVLLLTAAAAGAGTAAAGAPAGFAAPSTGATASAAPPAEAPPAEAALAEPFRRWLQEVAPLLTPAEREAFLGLSADYQRRAFIEAFWRVRDPFPETPRNELRERWEENARDAWQRFDGFEDARAAVFVANGEPAEVFPARCGMLLRPLEIWRYRGSPLIRQDFYVVFLEAGGEHRLWRPSSGAASILQGARGLIGDAEVLRQVEAECVQGSRLVDALTHAADWERIVEERALFPDPGEEWLRTFLTYSTGVPEGAETFPAELRLAFPGARGSRTVVQGTVVVPKSQARPEEAGGISYDYLVDGEVLRQDRLFEHFRYRFRLPARDLPGDSVPLLFQRYLRPGAYRLMLRVEELSSGRFFRREVDLEVPFVRRGTKTAAAGETVTGSPEAAPPALPAPASAEAAVDPAVDLVAEANQALALGDVLVRLLPPPPGLQVDRTRIEAEVRGEGVARVRFDLDGQPVMSKSRPPYSVELDLGEAPRSHEVVAVVLGADGEELARDAMLLNAGPHRFSVRLVEPQPGRRYATSLRAAAEVDVPEGDTLERVELFLDDDLVATLYQPPFVQPILLPPGAGLTYVRAVAWLAGGNHAEDVVLVNAPDEVDRLDVHFVELYTSVLDRRGRPVADLTADDFTVYEEGERQEVRRFERVENLPIYAGILLDTSSSMAEELDEALAAASRFFETVITPKDRAAVITFNHAPDLAVRFTSNPEVLAGGLAGVTAAGGTALHDSLIYALYYFSGVQGKRALVLISDGDDQGSRYGFEEALDYARRTGVTLYTIGLGRAGSDPVSRSKLMKLAGETGGQFFFIHRAAELANVYGSIEEELRTQYLLAYQSSRPSGGRSAAGDEAAFREVRVEVEGGAQAKTIRGYYP